MTSRRRSPLAHGRRASSPCLSGTRTRPSELPPTGAITDMPTPDFERHRRISTRPEFDPDEAHVHPAPAAPTNGAAACARGRESLGGPQQRWLGGAAVARAIAAPVEAPDHRRWAFLSSLAEQAIVSAVTRCRTGASTSTPSSRPPRRQPAGCAGLAWRSRRPRTTHRGQLLQTKSGTRSRVPRLRTVRHAAVPIARPWLGATRHRSPGRPAARGRGCAARRAPTRASTSSPGRAAA